MQQVFCWVLEWIIPWAFALKRAHVLITIIATFTVVINPNCHNTNHNYCKKTAVTTQSQLHPKTIVLILTTSLAILLKAFQTPIMCFSRVVVAVDMLQTFDHSLDNNVQIHFIHLLPQSCHPFRLQSAISLNHSSYHSVFGSSSHCLTLALGLLYMWPCVIRKY